jgi:hypothetical protein
MSSDLESAEVSPLIGKSVSKEVKTASRFTYIAVLLVAVLGLAAIVLNAPSTSAGTSVIHLSEAADAAAELKLFKLADTDADNTVSKDEVTYRQQEYFIYNQLLIATIIVYCPDDNGTCRSSCDQI